MEFEVKEIDCLGLRTPVVDADHKGSHYWRSKRGCDFWARPRIDKNHDSWLLSFDSLTHFPLVLFMFV